MNPDSQNRNILELFNESEKDLNGRIIEVRQLGVLFPNMASHMMILFGGEILKIVDEVSGALASLFASQQSVHIGEEVFFRKAIMIGETTRIIFRVVHTTPKIIVVHTQIFGGEFDIENFNLRYEGVSLCGVLGPDGKLAPVPQLSLPAEKRNTRIAEIAQSVVNFQKETIKKLDAWREDL